MSMFCGYLVSEVFNVVFRKEIINNLTQRCPVLHWTALFKSNAEMLSFVKNKCMGDSNFPKRSGKKISYLYNAQLWAHFYFNIDTYSL